VFAREAAAMKNPFDRPLDRLLQGLRRQCGPDSYRLLPGQGDERDRWKARCPLHPGVAEAWSGYTLLVTELPGHEADIWCQIGCPPWAIRYALLPDPEREREAERRAAVLLWAQSWKRAA
jgi:hypothetical protein